MRKKVVWALPLLVCLFPQITLPPVMAQIGDWTTKASLPQPISRLGMAVVDNKIFAIGGWIGGATPCSNTNFEYDPIADN